MDVRECRDRTDTELAAAVLGAYEAMSDAAEAARDLAASEPPLDRWARICRGVRDWAVTEPEQYTVIWGPPVPGFVAPEETMAAGARTVLALVDVVRECVASDRLALPDDGTTEVPASLRTTVADLGAGLLQGLPDHAVVGMLLAWTQLHGLLTFEVYGHIAPIADDPAGFFDHAMRVTGTRLGLPATTPAATDPPKHGGSA